ALPICPARNGRPCPRGLLGSAARRGNRAARILRSAGTKISAPIGSASLRCGTALVLGRRLRCATSPRHPVVRGAHAAIRGGSMSTFSHVVHLGDCLDPVSGLASLPDRSIDHVITDPPYEEEAHTKQRRGKRNGGVMKVESLSFYPITEDQRRAVAAQFGRLARRWVIVFCQV